MIQQLHKELGGLRKQEERLKNQYNEIRKRISDEWMNKKEEIVERVKKWVSLR